jgi:hypothetical protein
MGFQHLFSSNRAEIAESYFPIILEYAKRRGGVEASHVANGACNATGGAKGLPGAVHFTIQLAPGGLANSGDLGIHSNALFAGDKAVLFSHSYYLKTIILPRQARDKYRGD